VNLLNVKYLKNKNNLFYIQFAALCLWIIITLFTGAAFLYSLFQIKLTTHSTSWILEDRNYNFFAEIENPEGELGYWQLNREIPINVKIAEIAAEDRRFDNHPGVDLHSILRAVTHNYFLKSGYSGASTIAMQVARLQRGGSSNWFFKIADAFTALWITSWYGKDRVLKQYLTIAPYGNRIHGIGCASRRYFLKPAKDLSLAEASLLVAIPRAPGRMNVFNEYGLSKAKKRGRLILNRCRSYGWISTEQYKESLVELQSLKVPQKEFRDPVNLHAILNYKKMLYSNPHQFQNGLLRISIDNKLQNMTREKMAIALEKLFTRDVSNAAIMILDKKSREVLTYIGSDDYYDKNNFGATDHGNMPRSTGSLLKPFIYGLGMELGEYSSASILTDINFDFGQNTKSFIPENSDRQYMGPVLYKNALSNSRNIPAVQVLKTVGVNTMYRRLVELQLTPDDGLADYYGLGLSIGGLYCTLQSLCKAYLCLANDGILQNVNWLYTDSISNSGQRAFEPDITRMIQQFLSDPLARLPTFPRGGSLEYPFTVATKTGTSEGYRDSWCIAWSDKYLVGVWFGNADNRPMKQVTGYTGAAQLVKNILVDLHPDRISGLDDHRFPWPGDYKPVNICVLTGQRADKFTPYTSVEFFKPGSEPQEYSNVVQMLPIDTRNKLLAAPGCKDHIAFQPFIVLPLQFEDWARVQGLPVAPRKYSLLCGNSPIYDTMSVEITWPRSGARFFIDPEMPLSKRFIPFSCKAIPDVPSVLWFVNGTEYKVAQGTHSLKWPMSKGRYTFIAAIPGTEFRSKPVIIEIW
jgi:penicillin-binding protein 1C